MSSLGVTFYFTGTLIIFDSVAFLSYFNVLFLGFRSGLLLNFQSSLFDGVSFGLNGVSSTNELFLENL